VWIGTDVRSEELGWYGPAGETNLSFRRGHPVREAAVAALALCGRASGDPSSCGRFLAHAAEQLAEGGGIPFRGPDGNLCGLFIGPRLEAAAAAAVRCALLWMESAGGTNLRAFSAVNVGPVVFPDARAAGAGSLPPGGEVVRQAEALALALQPRQVIASPPVYLLVADRFDCHGVPPLGLWGPCGELPETLYVVEREKAPISWQHLLDRPAGPLFGRRRDLTELQRAWADSQQRPGTLVRLCAPPGAGKSRLLQAFLHGLEGGRPLPTVVKLAGACYGGRPGYLLQELAGVCGQMDPDLPGVKGRTGGWPRGETAREGMAVRLMTGLLRRRPLLIVIDDVHWCDPESLRAIAKALGDVPRGVMVILSYRPSGSRRAACFAAREARVLRLPPLSEAAAKSVWSQASGVGLSETQWRDVWRMAAGNPLYLEEAGRLVAEAVSPTQALGELPDSLTALLLLRIRRWGERQLDGLRRDMAFMGKSGVPGRLSEIERQIDDWLDRIETQRYFDRVEIAAFLGELEYCEARIREICFLSGVTRPLTTRLSEALSRLYDENSRDFIKHLIRLARDVDRGPAAGEQAGRAARRLLRRGRSREAARFFTLAVELHHPGRPGWADLREAAGDVHLLLGRPARAASLYRTVLDGMATEESERTARLQLKWSMGRFLQGEPAPTPLPPAGDACAGWLSILNAVAALRAGRFEETSSLARAAHDRHGGWMVGTAALLLAAWVALAQGKPEEAFAQSIRAAAGMRSGGPSLLALTLHWIMARIYGGLPWPPVFARYHERTWRRIARQLGIAPHVIADYAAVVLASPMREPAETGGLSRAL